MSWSVTQRLGLWLGLAMSVGGFGVSCSSDDHMEDTVARYGERLSEVKRASTEHEAAVSHAETPEEVAAAEDRYADRMDRTLSDMDQIVEAMGSCGQDADHLQNTGALREDVEAMRDMHAHHHEQITGAEDMQTVHAREGDYHADFRGDFEAWSEHHRNMANHAGDCPCGHMGGGTMGGGMMGGGMMGH